MSDNLPNSDDVLERHQFYAAMNAKQDALKDHLARQSESIHRIHTRMDDDSHRITKVHDAINTTETRNKTIAAAFAVFWTLVASALGWGWDKSTTKLESYVDKISILEKDSTALKTDLEKQIATLKTNQEKLDSEFAGYAALKRQVSTMQQEIDSYHEKNKKGR